MKLTWEQALAWRMKRHLIDPVGDRPVADVVDRLCGVQAQVASSAELATRLRRVRSRPSDVAAALTKGRLIKTWAMRGTIHLLTPEAAPAFLSLIASGRSWERPSWQKYFGVSPNQIRALRLATREALSAGPLTREELIAAVTSTRELSHIGDALGSGWGTLLKPLAWQGDLCFGPSRGNRVTFTLPEEASSRWPGIPAPEEAAPIAILSYLAAHGPATADAFGSWLAGGWFGTRQLKTWFADLGDRVSVVDIDGDQVFVRTEDLDDLAATKPSRALRLLGGFDQYLLAPGTGDGRVVPAERRPLVSKKSGWISPVVVSGGVVSGTWEIKDDRVVVAWFRETRLPRHLLEDEIARLAELMARPLDLEVDQV